MKPITSLFLALATLLPALSAQSIYTFRRPEPVESKSRISFSGQVLFGVSADLTNLGEIAYPSSSVTGGLTYNDGEVRPSASREKTTEYAFLMENTKIELMGDYLAVSSFDLTRYRSASLGTSVNENAESAYGWEVAYDYLWGKRADRWRLGVRAAFSFNDLDFTSRSSVEGQFIAQTDTFKVPTGTIVYEPGGSFNGSPAQGSPSIDPVNDLTRGPERDVLNPDGDVVPSQVDSVFSSNGVMANFRLGPIATLRLAYGFDLEVSAGFLGVFYSAEVSMFERLTNLPITQGLSVANRGEEFETGTDGQFLLGYYAEGLLRFRATERVSLYGSMMYVGLQDPKQKALANSQYRIAFETPVFATAGLTVFF